MLDNIKLQEKKRQFEQNFKNVKFYISLEESKWTVTRKTTLEENGNMCILFQTK